MNRRDRRAMEKQNKAQETQGLGVADTYENRPQEVYGKMEGAT